MIVQNNHTPWVVLILIVASLLVIAGLIIGGSEPLNPTRASQEAITRATLGAISAESTQMVLRPTQAALEAAQAYQAQVAEATAAPLRQVATRVAADAYMADLSRQATATAIARQSNALAKSLELQQSQVTWEQENARAERTLRLAGAAILYLATAGLVGAVIYWIVANGAARRRAAQAKMLVEQRRTMEVRAAIQSKEIPTGKPVIVERRVPRRKDGREGGASGYKNLPLGE